MRQTYLALELEFDKSRGYRTSNSKEVKKEHKEEAKGDMETEEEQEAPVPLVTYVNNILDSFFPKLSCTTTTRKFTALMDFMRTSLTFPTVSTRPSLRKKGVLHYDG